MKKRVPEYLPVNRGKLNAELLKRGFTLRAASKEIGYAENFINTQLYEHGGLRLNVVKTIEGIIGVKYSQYALEPKAKNEEEPKEKSEEKTDGCYKGLFNELHDNSDLRAALDLIIYMAFDDAIKNYEPRLKELIKQTVEEVFK